MQIKCRQTSSPPLLFSLPFSLECSEFIPPARFLLLLLFSHSSCLFSFLFFLFFVSAVDSASITVKKNLICQNLPSCRGLQPPEPPACVSVCVCMSGAAQMRCVIRQHRETSAWGKKTKETDFCTLKLPQIRKTPRCSLCYKGNAASSILTGSCIAFSSRCHSLCELSPADL